MITFVFLLALIYLVATKVGLWTAAGLAFLLYAIYRIKQ